MTTQEQKDKANAYARKYRAARREHLRAYHEQRRRAKGMKPFKRVTDPALPADERRRITDRLRYQRDKEKRLSANKEYRERNKASLKLKAAARAKADRLSNPEKFRVRARNDRRKHGDKRRKYFREWQRDNRDLMRVYESRYFEKNPGLRTAKNNLRRARMLAVEADGSADLFIKRIRSMKFVPCYYCGTRVSGKSAHIDHIQAVSKSGNHVSSNLCASCEFCNCSKNNRTLSEWVPPTNQPVLNL